MYYYFLEAILFNVFQLHSNTITFVYSKLVAVVSFELDMTRLILSFPLNVTHFVDSLNFGFWVLDSSRDCRNAMKIRQMPGT